MTVHKGFGFWILMPVTDIMLSVKCDQAAVMFCVMCHSHQTKWYVGYSCVNICLQEVMVEEDPTEEGTAIQVIQATVEEETTFTGQAVEDGMYLLSYNIFLNVGKLKHLIF